MVSAYFTMYNIKMDIKGIEMAGFESPDEGTGI